MATSVAGTDLHALVVARGIIRTSTIAITIPALWCSVITGVLLARSSARPRPRWLKAKLAIVGSIVVNTHLLIAPATRAALTAARDALASGALAPAYHRADLVETVAGSINVLLVLALLALAVLKPNLRRVSARAALPA